MTDAEDLSQTGPPGTKRLGYAQVLHRPDSRFTDRLGVVAHYVRMVETRIAPRYRVSKAGTIKFLGSAVDCYNRAVGSFESKVMPGARRFTELGVSPAKTVEEPAPIEVGIRQIAE